MSASLLGAILYVICGVAFCLLGLLVLRENPGARLHRVTATMLFFGGIGPVLGGIGELLTLLGEKSPLLQSGLSTRFSFVWALFFPSLVLFALVFPRERTILRRFPRLFLFLYAPHVFNILLQVVLLRTDIREAWNRLDAALPTDRFFYSILSLGGSMVGMALDGLARLHLHFFSVVNLVYIGAAILLLAKSLRGLRTAKIRRQLSVILFGLGSCLGLYAMAVPIPTILSTPLPAATRMVLLSVSLLLGTGSIAFAIVWRGFLDVGTVVRRAILFSATSGALAMLYFLTARQMDRVLMAEAALPFPLFQTLFIVLLVVFFHPLMGWIEDAVDRMLAGERLGHRDIMRRLGREMTAILDLPTLAGTIVANLREALAVENGYLVLRGRTGVRFQAAGEDGGGMPAIPVEHPLIRGLAAVRDPVTVPDLLGELETENDRKPAREILKAYQSQLVVPIHLPEADEFLGFLSLGKKVTGGRFNAEEMTLLSILATQVGIAVRNARLHEEAVERKVVDEELALARTIQQSILPREGPEMDGLDVAGLNVSSRHVGGDYFDMIPMENGDLGIAIGDVSGKGVPAALLMSMLHASLHAQMNGSVPVHRMLRRMNRILYRATSPEKFASFFFGIYHPPKRRFRYSNGGHNFPLVLSRDGSSVSLSDGGLLLGVQEEESYDEGSVLLRVGDLVLLYTDGVIEEWGPNGEPFGVDRLVAVARRHREENARRILAAIRDEVVDFTGRDRFSDDFTLIVLRIDH